MALPSATQLRSNRSGPRAASQVLDDLTLVTATEGFDAVATAKVAAGALDLADEACDLGWLARWLWDERLGLVFHHEVLPLASALLQGRADLALALLDALGSLELDRACLAELLQLCAFNPALREAVGAEVTAFINPWGPSVLAAQRVAALGLALGLVTAEPPLTHAPEQLGALAEALTHPATPAPLPPDEAHDLDLKRISTGESTLDALRNAALYEVAQHGVASTTMARICERARVPHDQVPKHLRRVGNLLGEVVDRRWSQVDAARRDFLVEVADRVSREVAEAVLWREVFRPEHRRAAYLAVEVERVARHDPILARHLDAARARCSAARTTDPAGSVAPVHPDSILDRDLTFSSGLQLLAVLTEGLAELPFDAVTVPLLA